MAASWLFIIATGALVLLALVAVIVWLTRDDDGGG
jgi:hypothetical protein